MKYECNVVPVVADFAVSDELLLRGRGSVLGRQILRHITTSPLRTIRNSEDIGSVRHLNIQNEHW